MTEKLGATKIDVSVNLVVHHSHPLLIREEELAVVIPIPEADATGTSVPTVKKGVKPKGGGSDKTTQEEAKAAARPTATTENRHEIELCAQTPCAGKWGPDAGYLLDGAITMEPAGQTLRYMLLVIRKMEKDRKERENVKVVKGEEDVEEERT